MGIGCVLMLWGVLLSCLGAPFSIALGIWSWRSQRKSRPGSLARPLAAAILPAVLLAYGAIAFISYAIWCGVARQVDPGLGDSWAVPIGNDYYFCMIDVTDHGYLMKGSCSGSPPVSDIVQLAAAGDRIIGQSNSSGAFVFDTSSDSLQTYDNLSSALQQMSPPPTLESPNTFYFRRRWSWLDLIAVIVIALPASLIIFSWYRLFIRAPSVP